MLKMGLKMVFIETFYFVIHIVELLSDPIAY